jgi:penicillin G amidase
VRWVRRIGLAVVLLMLVAVVATSVLGAVMARRSFPQTSGELAVAGLSAPVEVLRDGHGVPTIVASTSDDLFRAQGYVHAQDRFWEMDFRRHVTSGRLSELFGDTQLDTDRFVRTLGWRRVAEEEVLLLEDDTRAALRAYADGVNAWIGERSGSQLSIEHALLPVTGARGYQPEPWSEADSVAWMKAMAWDLRSNLEDELLRARLLGVDLGAGRQWQDLFPSFPADRHPPILPDGGEVVDGRWVPADGLNGDRTGSDATDTTDVSVAPRSGLPDAAPDRSLDAVLAAAHDALLGAPQLLGDGAHEGLGSNSWVVAPERSTTGSALLANDPHLGPSQPALWYQVGLRCEPVGPACPYHVAGYSFSGLPGIVIGHNERVGWGFTNLGPDVADLVIEHLDGDRYLTEDGWEDLTVTTDVLRVAGGDDVELTIRATRNGPLFSDVSDAGRELAGGPLAAGAEEAADTARVDEDGEYAVALRWVALDARPTADAILDLMQASDWDSFRAAAGRFEVPSQNLVYADVDGHIGYQAPGRIPVRRSGDGSLPLPGWTGEFGWDRFFDFEELPWALDPEAGWLATANQPVLPPGTEPFLTGDANLGYRAERITELLTSKERLSPEDLLDLQLDNHNGNAAHLVPYLLGIDAEDDERVAEVQQVLSTWDLQDDVDAAGAAAFNATWRQLLELTFHEALPEWAWPAGGGRWWEVVRGLTERPDSPWWTGAAVEGAGGRDDVLRASMAAAHDELSERFSSDPGSWRWGAMHTLALTHQSFGSSGVAPLERLFNRGPVEVAGGTDIVNANAWNATEGYEVVWVPSMRMVLDLGDLDAGRWVNLTGQSGRPFHPRYTDQVDLWRTGGTIPIAFTAGAVDDAAEERLVLVPAD